MNKLLRANFARLWKNRLFYLSTAIMAMIGAALPIALYMDIKDGYSTALESDFFVYAVLIVIISSAFTALFIGTEYSDGTMRNKIVVGHKRRDIYLANLIICVFAGMCMCAAYIIAYLSVGIPLVGFFERGAIVVILLALAVFAMMTAFIALYALIAMLCPNKAYTAAACILLGFLMLFAGVMINSALNEPEYYDAYVYTENGVTVTEEMIANANYLTGTKREIYEFLYDFLPGGQVIQITGMTADDPGMMALYDLVILSAATVLGIAIFRKKDLK
ncbi:MAG: ABC transporter permease subunit [Clostridia bacterium]|nr:ABC transporter permease subunit [Clostridia bacterium]